ncbi:hypothetical protein OAG71_01315 [bacterium]|nr:hypothetical protein [bacterium]
MQPLKRSFSAANHSKTHILLQIKFTKIILVVNSEITPSITSIFIRRFNMLKNTIAFIAICFVTFFASTNAGAQTQDYSISGDLFGGGEIVGFSGIFGIDLNAVDNDASADVGAFELTNVNIMFDNGEVATEGTLVQNNNLFFFNQDTTLGTFSPNGDLFTGFELTFLQNDPMDPNSAVFLDTEFSLTAFGGMVEGESREILIGSVVAIPNAIPEPGAASLLFLASLMGLCRRVRKS